MKQSGTHLVIPRQVLSFSNRTRLGSLFSIAVCNSIRINLELCLYRRFIVEGKQTMTRCDAGNGVENSDYARFLRFLFALFWMSQAAWPAFANEENRTPVQKPLRWVGLFNDDMINWMERENRAAMTLRSMTEAEAERYRQELRQPKSWEVEVRQQPGNDAALLGKLIITAQSGQGLKASFLSSGASNPVPFTPDLYESDYGYGPYFHQTVLQQKKTWFQLPKNPLPQPGWVDFAGFNPKPNILAVSKNGIYWLGKESVVIIDSDGDTMTYRLEQEGDYCCCSPEPPIRPAKTWRIPYGKFFTPDAHLRLDVKHKKGC